MNTDNWNFYFKTSQEGNPCMAQQTYEPLVSPDGQTFCKNYSFPNQYQYFETTNRPLYTQDVVDWFFENEIKWIEHFKNKPYAPEVLEIDRANKKIFLKWYRESCNQVMYSGRMWSPNWLTQIKDIILDQYSEGVYKLTMYPHCHYIDNNDNMRAIVWYGCVPVNTPYVEERYLQGIIHETARFRLDETGDPIDRKLNLEVMFKKSLGQHVLWGDSDMSYIYKELFDA
jgi:hypothetical protein